MTIIRLSPSGAPITNAGGGPLNPGPGAILRMAEAFGIMESDPDPFQLPLTPGIAEMKPNPANALAPFTRPQLLNPNPALRYSGFAEVIVLTSGTIDLTGDPPAEVVFGTGFLLLSYELSFDGGATWPAAGTVQNNTFLYQAGVLLARIALPMELGSVYGMPAGAPSITARLQAAAVAPGEGDNDIFVRSDDNADSGDAPGNLHVVLYEHF